jgi:hypothetical protein
MRPPSALLLRTAQTLLAATTRSNPMAAATVLGGLAGPSGRVGAAAAVVSLRRGIGGLASTSTWRPAPPPHRPPPPTAAAPDSPGATSPNLPPPLTVTRLPPSASPPSPADLANAFAAAGFGDVKVVHLDADHALSSHATPVPKLLGVASGRFLISVDADPAEDGASSPSAPKRDESAALQLSAGTFLLMPAGVRHSAWVVGGAPVDLVMGSRPAA